MMKWNYLTGLAGKIASGVALLSLLIIASCKDDEPQIKPVTVEFSTPSQTINENGGPQNLTINFSGNAGKDGDIELTVTPANAADFVSIPSTISVTKGNSAAQITVTPVNNTTIDGAKQAIITLANPTSGFELGTQTTFTLNIADDEGEVAANFEVNEGSIAENLAEGVTVNILLSDAADEAGNITVSFPAEDAPFFTADPAVSGTSITLPVAAGATNASFKVIPVNDAVDNANYVIDFTISNTTGGVIAGTSTAYTLTITDDDDEALATIADVRALFTGTDFTISGNIYVQGVVISSSSNYTNRNLFIQDATGSIVLRFASAHSFVQGDEIKVNIETALLTKDAGSGNTGPLQVGGTVGVANAKASKVSDGVLPSVTAITIDQLNSGNYEGKLVSLAGVAFPDADGILTLQGSRIASNGTATTIVRTENFTSATWKSDPMPYGFGTIQGIASVFNGAAQVIPQAATDIFASSATGSLNVTQALTDFGSVNNGAESASQSYTVQGTGLAASMVITASANYKVSTDNSTFASSVTIDAAGANSLNTIYVKFAPATGVNQAIAGTITHKALGAEPQSFAVGGTESGNASSSILYTESFDSYAVGTALTSIGWDVSAANTTNVVSVISGGLSYTDYPLSGGNGVAVANNGQDIYETFAPQSSGSVYVSFLVNITAVQTNGDYFFAVSPSAAQTSYTARLHAKTSGAGFVLGIKKSNETNASYGTTVLSLNTTYLIVLKYTFNTGSTTDDAISVFVNPAIVSEPGTGEINAYTEITKNDSADLGSVAIRQGSSTSAATLTIDGIRVALSWTDLFN